MEQDVLTLDPIAMNVVNRVAAGSDLRGDLAFDGGLLVQGKLSGTVHVHGSLIVWAGATVSGRLRVAGDFYLFGRLGAPGDPVSSTTLECLGRAYVASSGVSTGTLLARRLQLYEGADLQGPFKTLRGADNIPVLHEAVGHAAEVNPERPRKHAVSSDRTGTLMPQKEMR